MPRRQFGTEAEEKEAMAGRKVGVMLTGGNVDAAVFREVLAAA